MASKALQSPLPLAAAPTGRRLRDSCNRCAASKIKCSKEKPSCARCAKQGKVCEYFETKRAGRKPGNRARNLISPPPPVTQTWLSATMSEPEGMQPSPVSPSSEDYSNFFPVGFASANSTMSTPFNFQLLDECPTTSLSLSMLDLPDGDDFTSLLASSDTPSAVGATGLEPAVQPADGQDTPGLIYNFTPTIGLLKGLCSLSTKSYSASMRIQPGPRHLPTIHSVISSNEQTVKAINEMLQCDCTEDGYLLVILSVTLLKILATYATVVRQIPNLDVESPCWVPMSLDPPNQPQEELGEKHNYGVDCKDQARLVGQQILSQLHRVQRLVNTLSQHFQTAGGRDGAPSTPPFDNSTDLFTSPESLFPFPASMLDQMEASLRKRLRDLSAEIMDLLR
nr:Myb-like transcriptional regulator [Trichoderma crystalligenum]